MFTRNHFEKGTLTAIKTSHAIKLYLYYDDLCSLWFVSAYSEMYTGVKGLPIPDEFIGSRKLSYQDLCDYVNSYCFNGGEMYDY